MSDSTARTWFAGRTPASTHRVVDGTSDAFLEAPGLTLQEVADEYLRGYDLPPDDDGSPIRFTVEQLDTPPPWTFTGAPNQPATPAPRRGRPPTPPHLTRAQVTIRLPQWVVDWMDAQAGTDRTSLIEEAMLKRYKLKAPKS